MIELHPHPEINSGQALFPPPRGERGKENSYAFRLGNN